VDQAVVAEVVAERALRLRLVRVHGAGDHEVGVGGDAEALVVVGPAERAVAEHAGEDHLGQPLGQRHDGGERVRGRAADEDADLQRPARRVGLRLVHADAAVDLVVQPDLAVLLVLVAAELDAVHAEVRVHDARASTSSV
jgi:hypothetical protein